jgi:hypothetical protein
MSPAARWRGSREGPTIGGRSATCLCHGRCATEQDRRLRAEYRIIYRVRAKDVHSGGGHHPFIYQPSAPSPLEAAASGAQTGAASAARAVGYWLCGPGSDLGGANDFSEDGAEQALSRIPPGVPPT